MEIEMTMPLKLVEDFLFELGFEQIQKAGIGYSVFFLDGRKMRKREFDFPVHPISRRS